jgi:AhpD family alkylhydroperoxidase
VPIALAIAVGKECDGCIAAHAHAAVLHGATPAEAAEATGATFLMNGGPAIVYGARAFAAFQELYAERGASRTAAASRRSVTDTLPGFALAAEPMAEYPNGYFLAQVHPGTVRPGAAA